MFGLGKKTRTRFKAFLDRHGVEQKEFAIYADISEGTCVKLCKDKEYIPSPKVMAKVMKGAKRLDPTVRFTDFWNP